jgi:hypothetical protein
MMVVVDGVVVVVVVVTIILMPNNLLLIPVSPRSKAWVCGRSLAGIVGSNPTSGMDVYLL